MFKYIGIRGHRGAGKNTISFLLGNTIDYYIKHKTFDGYDEVFNELIEVVMEEDGFIQDANLHNVYFDSFADTPKIMLSQILNIPSEWMYDDWMKDSVFINMKDFSFECAKDKLALNKWDQKTISAFELFEQRNQTIGLEPKQFNEDCWISLRELILYFGRYCMQNYFGLNVWVKSLNASQLDLQSFFANNKTVYKVFVDVKFPTEVSYIKNNGGYIVKVSRPQNEKSNSDISNALDDDDRVDFDIIVDDLHNLRETFECITLSILNND